MHVKTTVKASFQQAHTLMVQGTTSDAGKSILVAALCRILARRGHAIAPFKPQNMALNSAVTADGGEIGRAQAVQAEAAFIKPHVDMNPVLLKPNSEMGAQVIVSGKALGNYPAQDYHALKPQLLGEVVSAHQRLTASYDAIIVEGAGSPAEINLRDRDIANMGFAETVDCPVIIIADIHRGGVFAHLVGTYELLSETEKARVVGFVINCFRGDIALLQPGIDWLEQRLPVPVLAVIPFIPNLYIEAEDAIDRKQFAASAQQLKVVVPAYPRASNHTDFDVLRMHPQVDLSFEKDAALFDGADLIILPGSKNVRDDLQWLKDAGWQQHIQRHLRLGGKVMGICGGYQMLGQAIHDPEAIESQAGSSAGLGLLALETTLAAHKVLRNVSGCTIGDHLSAQHSLSFKGYEIHAGVTQGSDLAQALFELSYDDGLTVKDGAVNHDNNVLGSYVHGLFDAPDLLQALLMWAGLEQVQGFDFEAFKEQQFERLADEVEQVLPYQKLCQLLNLTSST